MQDVKKIIAWLADTELYYREEGKTENDMYQSEMAYKTIKLIEELFDERYLYEEWKEGYGEIIRCKDCVHYHPGFCCDLMQKPVFTDSEWFCADGERKEHG